MINTFNHNISKRRESVRGFTLIELVVVLGVVTVISAVTLAGYSKFGTQTLLRSLVYDMALTVRQTQVHGISASIFSGDLAQIYGHGLLFDLASANNAFILYADSNDLNKFYTPSVFGNSELLDTYTLGRGYSISSLCYDNGSGEICGTAQQADILFIRPEPDALIRVKEGGVWVSPAPFKVRIVVESPQDEQLSVVIEAGGQISVQRLP